MRDFTLQAYSKYINAIKKSFNNIMTHGEYLALDKKPDIFCLVRHDVDRFPKNALKMALLEKDLNIKATYYFRTKNHTFKPDIIRKIYSLGHEIGYHYESLSDCNGDIKMAIENFAHNLSKLRTIAPIHTISMHGRPLKKFDNRDLWRDSENKKFLYEKFDILGEVYLDINYTDIAYILDSGRNWFQYKNNLRDKVNSKLERNFNTGAELLNYLEAYPDKKIIFQIHPENWNDNYLRWVFQFLFVSFANFVKNLYAKTY